MQPDQWQKAAREEAERTLLAVAEPNQRQFIPEFLNTVTAALAGGGLSVRMGSPFKGAQTLGDYQAARSAVRPGDLGMSLFQANVEEFRDLMTEWVEKEKKKDARDAGKSDEMIGEFISWIMLTPSPSIGQARARASLMPHIIDFLQRQQATTQLDAKITDTWLKAVLASWRGLVRARFPGLFCAAVRAGHPEAKP